MISDQKINKIKTLRDSGVSVSQISENLNISIPSIYKYIKTDEKNIHQPEISNKIKPFVELIEAKLKSNISNNIKIFEYLKLEGFQGSYGLLNKHIKNIKKQSDLSEIKAYRRVETPPGEQAQVDWGHFGKITMKGIKLNLYVFVYVLSYSRAMYAEFTTSQKQSVWQQCHVNAFHKLGVPKKIRYDNVKTVVISREKEKINYNFDFLNFSRHYKFEAELCPIYYPRSKGKVEAGVKYIRNNFMPGKKFAKNYISLQEPNAILRQWLEEYANHRIHSTTKEKPITLWNKEKENLLLIHDYPPFYHTGNQSRFSSQNCMVTYKKSSYCVPPNFARKKIDIEEEVKNGVTKLIFYFKGNKVIEHNKSSQSGAWILLDEHKSRKVSNKNKEILKDLYQTKVETRGIDYYNNLI